MADIKSYIAEFVGTFILVFTVGCNVLSKQSVWAGVSIACSLMVSIYALAPISGANFNPAVSVTLGITGNLVWQDVAAYSFVQILAGVLAGFLYHLLFGAGFALGPVGAFSWWQAGVCELLYTFMLCFVVLNTACSNVTPKKHPQIYGLSIGFVIVAGAYGAGAVSGGCFNPAVALGIEAGSLSFGYSPLYILFELAGAALAALLFKVVRPEPFEKGDAATVTAELPAKVASEIIGTYMLVLTVGLNVLAKSPSGAFSIAASLMCMIFALGDVSGAHFNPAVTTAILAIKGIEAKEAAIYACAQLIGGILAACTYTAIYKGESFALGPGKGFGLAQVAAAETFFTFVLCFVVLSVALSPHAKEDKYSNVFGLAIGSCVTVGGFAIGAISGGSLNPAVSFGIAAGDAIGGANVGGIFKEGLLYTLFELVGAGVAALAYFGTHGAAAEKADSAQV
jgi:aquaporin Z